MATNTASYYGVYRVLASGGHVYVSRSVTSYHGLARDIARDLSRGVVIMPDGSLKNVRAYPHIAKEITQ
jgi:hypothetical protein